jgi:hypothetical protein
VLLAQGLVGRGVLPVRLRAPGERKVLGNEFLTELEDGQNFGPALQAAVVEGLGHDFLVLRVQGNFSDALRLVLSRVVKAGGGGGERGEVGGER